jgi:GAF domain-containing protein
LSEDTTDRSRISNLERRLEDEAGRFRRLVQVATQLSSTLNLETLLQLIMTSAAELLDAETSSLLLVDEQTDDLVFEVVAGGPAEDLSKRRVPRGEGIAGWVVAENRQIIIDDASSDSRIYRDVGQSTGFTTRNLVAVPLVAKDRTLGVVEVLNKHGDERFDDTDVEVAEALASLAAVAIENAFLYSKLTDAVVEARLSYRL